ncbi:MAG: hypothetical protein F7C33_01145 [Desulfurococcales archaeon]|nr:hypothetical protein [Desulfurococcales archaeon]
MAKTPVSLEERVERLEKYVGRQRIYSAIRTTILVLILIGVAIYLYGLYETRGEWRVEASGTPRVGLESPRVLHVEVYVKIHNPTKPVVAKLVYYRVYLDGYYAGDGFIPYLKLPHGDSVHKITLSLDLSRASCGLAKALEKGGTLRVRVAGFAMVDLKTWGGFTWRTVTVPFNVTAGQVNTPQLDPATRAFLGLYTYVCDHPDLVYGIISGGGGQSGLPGFPKP